MNSYNIDAQALGERIRKLRLKKNKTQAYFADILYISPSYLALIEAGKRVPNLDVLVHIAEITDVSIDYSHTHYFLKNLPLNVRQPT